MKKRNLFYAVLIGVIFIGAIVLQQKNDGLSTIDNGFVTHIVDPHKSNLEFFHKDENGKPFGNHGTLKAWLDNRSAKLIFAMNGGMYQEDLTPLGLYIEKGKVLKQTNRVQKAHGNFYLQPNGIFYITKENKPGVIKTVNYVPADSIQYATQSGPMLLIDGDIHPSLREGSSNLHIRNGVGILPDGKILFAMSKEKVNFYDFASLFKENGCQNALYLDGFVSKAYIPEIKWEQMAGKFGVVLAEIEYVK